MLGWIVLGGLALLVLVACFIRSSWFGIVVMLTLLLTLIVRDLSIDSYVRSHIGQKAQEGRWTEQYKDGAVAIATYCATTRGYVFGVAVLVGILFVRVSLKKRLPPEK